MRNWFITAVLTSLLVTGPSIYAATYKWVDENGNIHYSQTPPRGKDKKYERLDIKVPRGGGDSSSPASPTAPGAGSDAGNTDEIIKQQLQDGQAQRSKNCEIAKEQLNVYSVHRRIREPEIC